MSTKQGQSGTTRTGINNHTTKQAGTEATAAVAAPAPSEPAAAATRYEGDAGGTNEHEGHKHVQGGCTNDKVSMGGMN